MKKMAQFYAAEEVMKYAMPKVKQQFSQLTSGSSNRQQQNHDNYNHQQQNYASPPPYQQNYQQHGYAPGQYQNDSYPPPPHQQHGYAPGLYQNDSYPPPPHQQHYDQRGYAYGSSSNQNGRHSSDSSLANVGKMAEKAVRETGKVAAAAGRKVKGMIDGDKLKSMCKDGNIIQLVSLSNGKSLQILQASNGELVLDGNGGVGEQFYNAHFHVCKDPIDHGLRFHNQYNYVAIVNAAVVIIHQEPGQQPHPATKFKVKTNGGHSIQLESTQERRRFIEVSPYGEIKPTAFSSQESADAQFTIHMIFRVNH